jgi:outer membrane receptor for ferrienterochelin and colicin
MKKSLRFIFPVSFLAMYMFSNLNAQVADSAMSAIYSMSIEELMNTNVTIATKSDQPIIETPSIVSVITAQDIKNMGARELEDVLQTVPGFELIRSYSGYYEVGIRGVKNSRNTSRLLVMIDGIPFNQIFYGASIDYGYDIDINAIDRIEIIRGPGSALYGRNAFSGVINIITKNAKSGEKFIGKGSLGTFNTNSLSGFYGYQNDKFNASIAVRHLNTDINDAKFPNSYQDTVKWNLNRNNYSVNSTIGYGKFTFSGMYLNLDNGINSAHTRVIHKLGIYSLSYDDFIGPKISVNGKIFGQNSKYIQDLEILKADFIPVYPLGIYYKPQFNEYLYGAEAELKFKLNYNNNLLFGIQTDAHGVYDVIITANVDSLFKRYPDPVPGLGRNNQQKYKAGWFDNEKHNYTNIAFYIQDLWNVTNNIQITIGGRYDYDSEIGGVLNPRTGIVWEPFKNYVFKLLYGRAYRAPTPEEQYKTLGFVYGNKNLKPEIINTYEFAFIQRYHNITNSVSLYRNQLKDMIYGPNVTSVNRSPYYNIGKNISAGIEYENKTLLFNSLYSYLNYSYSVSKNTNINNGRDSTFDQEDIAPHMINFGLNYSFLNHYVVNVNMLYRSKMKKLLATDPQTGNLVDVQDNIGNYAVFNTCIQIAEFPKNLNISLSIYNLLNKKYYSQDNDHLHQPHQPGRQYICSIVYSIK